MKNSRTAIKNVGDIQSGAIITTKKNHNYVLLRDDSGVPAMYGKDGRFVRLNPNGLSDVKGGHEIAKVSVFATMPQADQISEALKYLYTGREACAELFTIFEVESEEVKEAKLRVKEITNKVAGFNKELKSLLEVLQENDVDVARLVAEVNAEVVDGLINDDEDEDDDYDCYDDEDEWDD